jgi:FMN phosphatase YigB (HAD superfamily)
LLEGYQHFIEIIFIFWCPVAFTKTDTILSNLKAKGLEIWIISDGNRSQINTWLDDPILLDRFMVVVMSDDEEVGEIRKPKAKIFKVVIDKRSERNSILEKKNS